MIECINIWMNEWKEQTSTNCDYIMNAIIFYTLDYAILKF